MGPGRRLAQRLASPAGDAGRGVPLLAALVWGTFVAPKAAVPVPELARRLLEVVIFGAASAALAATDHPRLALALALTALGDRVLLSVWRQ